MNIKKLSIVILFFNIIIFPVNLAASERLLVAVASNFHKPALAIAREFEKNNPYEVIISSASTGKLYAQIINGAPFDIFLAADEITPKRLEDKNYTVKGSRFTYAYGRLVLWGKPGSESGGIDMNHLKTDELQKVAIANPKLAPYGQAAREVLINLNLYNDIESKLIYGENINQTFQYIITGAAEAGFVAMSQIYILHDKLYGNYWVVPEVLYKPIRQQAVLLTRASDSKAASFFLTI